MINILLYILIGLVLIILSVLLVPIHIIIEYNKNFKVKFKFLFFIVPIFPFPYRITKKNAIHTEKKNSTDNNISDIIKKQELKQLIQSLKQILDILKTTSRKILSHIKFKFIRLNLGIAGNNAYDIAIKYGQACTLISNIFARIENWINIEKFRINVYPDFIRDDHLVEFKLDLQSSMILILYEMVVFYRNYAKILNELKYIKGGEQFDK